MNNTNWGSENQKVPSGWPNWLTTRLEFDHHLACFQADAFSNRALVLKLLFMDHIRKKKKQKTEVLMKTAPYRISYKTNWIRILYVGSMNAHLSSFRGGWVTVRFKAIALNHTYLSSRGTDQEPILSDDLRSFSLFQERKLFWSLKKRVRGWVGKVTVISWTQKKEFRSK